MNRELLEKPFAPAQIRQRKGRNGLLDYIEGHSVIHRLNQALEGAWSFEITHHDIREDEVLVLGKLTLHHGHEIHAGHHEPRCERVPQIVKPEIFDPSGLRSRRERRFGPPPVHRNGAVRKLVDKH